VADTVWVDARQTEVTHLEGRLTGADRQDEAAQRVGDEARARALHDDLGAGQRRAVGVDDPAIDGRPRGRGGGDVVSRGDGRVDQGERQGARAYKKVQLHLDDPHPGDISHRATAPLSCARLRVSDGTATVVSRFADAVVTVDPGADRSS
jgi:hypothetical protein